MAKDAATSYPRYWVTYTVQDTDAGANLFGHALLMLSQQDDPSKAIQVTEAFGFYSEYRTSSTTNKAVLFLKKLLNFDMDLQDSHGHLQQECLHYLDGLGNTGISFDLTKAQHNELIELFQTTIKNEKAAITEMDKMLKRKNETINAHTRLKLEHQLATEQGRSPRLQMFHVTMSLRRHGFDTSESYTCKNLALDFLLKAKVISSSLQEQFLGSKFESAFPRFARISLPRVQLVSTGPLQRHTSKKKGIVYIRKWESNQLFWATMPDTLNNDPIRRPQSTPEKGLILKLQHLLARGRRIERDLRATCEKLEYTRPDYQNDAYYQTLQRQLNRIQHIYPEFKSHYYNQSAFSLKARLERAEIIFNIAELTLKPQKANYPFLLRALTSVLIRNALIGMLTSALAIAFLTGGVGVVVSLGATLFSGYNLYQFIQGEMKYSKARIDYMNFTRTQQAKQDEPDLGNAHVQPVTV